MQRIFITGDVVSPKQLQLTNTVIVCMSTWFIIAARNELKKSAKTGFYFSVGEV